MPIARDLMRSMASLVRPKASSCLAISSSTCSLGVYLAPAASTDPFNCLSKKEWSSFG